MKAPQNITAIACLACLPLGAMARQAVEFETSLLNPVMATAEVRQARPEFDLKAGHNVIRVSVKGLVPEKAEYQAPLNISLVIDRSGSMNGGKIEKAKDAAKEFVKRLSPNDIISIIAYDSKVSVIVPATKASDQGNILESIDKIQIAGNTALFGGVSKAAGELRKFLGEQAVNRVLLLSDGQANVGPSSPQELAELGRSLAKEGITVSTIGLGLGYNEDLMSQLAMTSDGTHSFIEEAASIGKVFDIEFRSLKTIVATELEATITCSSGVRPVRVLGQEADIDGQNVNFEWLQLSSGQERFFLLEVEVDPRASGDTLSLGKTRLSYENPINRKEARSATTRELGVVSFIGENESVVSNQDKEVTINLAEQKAIDSSRRAVTLRDEGKVEEALKEINDNILFNASINKQVQDKRLEEVNLEQTRYAEDLKATGKDYNRAKKEIRSRNANLQQQKEGVYRRPQKVEPKKTR